MASIGRYVFNSLFGPRVGEDTNAAPAPPEQSVEQPIEQPIKQSTIMYSSDRYQPSINDVFVVKELLRQKCGLPLELIDVCIDHAQYWPHTSSFTPSHGYPKSVRAGVQHENQFILRSYPIGFLPDRYQDQGCQISQDPLGVYQTTIPKPYPESREIPQDVTNEVLREWASKSLPRGEFPCRKIVFTIKSHDQGWGGSVNQRGTYRGSYTWFDAGLERMSAFHEDTLQDAWEIAPHPQFRLSGSDPQSQRNDREQDSGTASPSPIVCSFRTLVPETVARSPPPDAGESSHMFSHKLLETPKTLQRNITAVRDTKEHVITWSCDDNMDPEAAEAKELEKVGRGRGSATGEFVRNLKAGDVVTVWAKARFPGWVNVINEAKIDVYWAM